MCDFKPGDEVVCVDATPIPGLRPTSEGLSLGETYTVREVLQARVITPHAHDVICVRLAEIGFEYRPGLEGAYLATRFRKVQRRDLSAWLETAAKNTDALDKPRRAPAKERA